MAYSRKLSFSLSVVSHGQSQLVEKLLHDLASMDSGNLEVLLTLNIPETLGFDSADYPFPVRVINNPTPKGFGANHNQAFALAEAPYFCVVNPDIRLADSPFQSLLDCLRDASVGIAAPMVLSPHGSVEDSARRFPTFQKLWGKLFRRRWTSDYILQDSLVNVDWAAGMFMMFHRAVFAHLNGFNERYYLYYEDVDICARANLAGLRVVLCPTSRVIHHAQRSSHRKLKYLYWHLGSMLRFLSSAEYRQLRQLKRL
jgi:N-acetylglucosaminyl-diphospho-decaprenol L-rhamnosyltransferase